MRAGHWTVEEVEATVDDYLSMLKSELAGRNFNKTEHRRRLFPRLRGRTEPSIELKHANISAVLIELGFPYISGYKPRGNYQRLLREVIQNRLAKDRAIQQLAAVDAISLPPIPEVSDILKVVTQPPKPTKGSAARTRRFVQRNGVNYLELEAQNQALGLAGEEFVLRFERARLIAAGRDALADRIQHVSRDVGDGEGYDIRSFEASGSDRFIEVKTTKYGRETPFYLSRNELRVSQCQSDRYHLYRVFTFRTSPHLFTLKGALDRTCTLDPVTYIGSAA